MDNNFRQFGNVYLSKAGRPDSPGGDPNDPRSVLTGQEDSQSLVLSTGVYQWPTSFIYNRPGFNNLYMRPDGRVLVQGDGHSRYQWLTAGGCTFAGLRFEQFAGFQFAHSDSNPPYYTQCEFAVLPAFAGSPNSGAIGRCTFEDCVFQNVHFSGNDTGGLSYGQGGNLDGVSFTRCLFFNCTFASPAYRLTQCYFDPTTTGWVSTQGNGYGPSTIGANNVDPAAAASQGYGLRVDQGPAGHESPQGYQADPLFNAVDSNEFSVRAGSPHLAADIGPRQYRQGRAFVVQAPAAGQAVEAANTRFAPVGGGEAVGVVGTTHVLEATDAGALLIRPDATPDGTARLRTDRIRHATGLPREISYMQVLGGNNFNTSYPALASQLNAHAPEVFNNNVPDLSAYASGEAGRNPNRLSYYLRWSTLPDPRLDHPEDWATGADMVECEWNARPLYNPATNIGNGRAEFVVSEGRPVICTWYQLEIGLTNLYYH